MAYVLQRVQGGRRDVLCRDRSGGGRAWRTAAGVVRKERIAGATDGEPIGTVTAGRQRRRRGRDGYREEGQGGFALPCLLYPGL